MGYSTIEDLEAGIDRDRERRLRELVADLGRSPTERADLFRSTPTGPGTTYHPDGTATRTEGHPAEDGTPLPEAEAPVTRRMTFDEPWSVTPSGVTEPTARARTVRLDEPISITGSSSTEASPDDAPETPDARAARLASLEALLDEPAPSVASLDAGERPPPDPMRVQGDGRGDLTGAAAVPYREPTEQSRGRSTRLDDLGWASPPTLSMDGRVPFTNPDGSTSTVRTISVGMPEGEVLLPTITPDGRSLTTDQAIEEYRRTGRHLGIYDSVEAAERAAAALHDREASRIAPLGSGAALASPRRPVTSAAPVAALSSPPPPAGGGERPRGSSMREAAGVAALLQMFQGLAQIGAGLTGAGRVRPMATSSLDALMQAAQAEDASAERDAARAADDSELTRRLAAQERLAMLRSTRTPTELELSREERLRRADERRAQLSERSLDLRDREVTSRLGRAEDEAALADARRTASSPESIAARRRLRALAEGLPSALRADLADELASEEWTAEDVERMERAGPGWWRSLLGRRGGGGGGGGGAGLEALLDEAVRVGIAPDREAAERLRTAVGSEGLRREVLSAVEAPDVEGDGPELVDGIRAGVNMLGSEVSAWRSGWRSVRSRMDALREIEAIGGRYGASAAISPEAAAELEPYMMTLRGMAADVQGTGVINPTEMPAINAALPDATSITGMTFGRFQGALRSWRSLVETGVRHGLEDYGVADADTERAMRALRSGRRVERARTSSRSGGDAGASTVTDSVRVRGPDGTVRRVPADRIPENGLPDGYEVVE